MFLEASVLYQLKPGTLKQKVSKSKLSDNEVISLYLDSQSSTYFDLLYDRYINKVYSKCISLLKNETLAQDAAQEIFLKIFMNLAKFNRQSRFSTWVYSITYNFCIDFLRRQKKSKKIFSNVEVEGEDIVEEVSDKEILEMELERLVIVLEKIPVEDKAVLLMKYKDDLSIKEIGAVFDKSESAIKMKIKRAKHKARIVYMANYANK